MNNIESLVKSVINHLKLFDDATFDFETGFTVYVRRLPNRYNKSYYQLNIIQDYDRQVCVLDRESTIFKILQLC